METEKPDLVWIGVDETCDLCGDIYPMSWITFTGRQFLCAACVCDEPELSIQTQSQKPTED